MSQRHYIRVPLGSKPANLVLRDMEQSLTELGFRLELWGPAPRAWKELRCAAIKHTFGFSQSCVRPSIIFRMPDQTSYGRVFQHADRIDIALDAPLPTAQDIAAALRGAASPTTQLLAPREFPAQGDPLIERALKVPSRLAVDAAEAVLQSVRGLMF